MINYLKGQLVSIALNSPQGHSLTIEVNNIGYIVQINSRIAKNLPQIGSDIQIFTSLIHKEDAMLLCGFLKHEDRDLFNILQSVSGVGIKVALLLLDELSASELMQAVLSENATTLAKTKGVGPKLAKRLILELKDKLKAFYNNSEIDISETKLSEINSDNFTEAQSVLLALGYASNEISTGLNAAVEKLGKDASSEELLKTALEIISF